MKSKKLNSVYLIIFLIFVLFVISCHKLPQRKISINGHIFAVEVASKPHEQIKGLGERDCIPENSGMLFVYDFKDRWTFWMKGMRFGLDFIWIDGDKIVDITKNVPPPHPEAKTFPTITPSVLVDKVLELNAGITDKYDIKIGDRVIFFP